MSIISLEHMQKQQQQNQKQWYIHDLLDIINNCIKYELNRLRTKHFYVKLFDTAVPLKYNQYHWVKVVCKDKAQWLLPSCSLTFIFIMSKKIATLKVFATYRNSASHPNADHCTDSHFSWESTNRKHQLCIKYSSAAIWTHLMCIMHSLMKLWHTTP